MKIIVCGYGEVGRNVVKRLETAGVDFTVIDINKDVFNSGALPEDKYIVGDATKEQVLIDAGIYMAPTLIATTSSDSTNAFITLTANALNPEIVVLARVNSMKSMDRLYKAGADYVIPETQIAARSLIKYATEIFVAELADKISLAKDIELIDLVLPENSVLDGKTISKSGIKEKYDVIIIAVKRGEKIYPIPPADFVLKKGDTVVVLGKTDNIDEFLKYYRGNK